METSVQNSKVNNWQFVASKLGQNNLQSEYFILNQRGEKLTNIIIEDTYKKPDSSYFCVPFFAKSLVLPLLFLLCS